MIQVQCYYFYIHLLILCGLNYTFFSLTLLNLGLVNKHQTACQLTMRIAKPLSPLQNTKLHPVLLSA